MMSSRAVRLVLWLLSFVAMTAATRHAHADQYLVQPGESWDSLGPKLKAGDEILLKPGVHRPASFTALQGSTLAPIIIRCSEVGKLTQIAPEREAIKLVDCKHIRVQGIGILNARRAGILIESTTRFASEDISIHDVMINGVKGLAEESGIVARGVTSLDIRRCRIENCAGNGVQIEECEQVTIVVGQILAIKPSPMKNGIALLGRVWNTQIENVVIMGSITTGISLGMNMAAPAASATAAPQPLEIVAAPPSEPLVRFLSVANCRGARLMRFLEIGSCADAVVRNCTVAEPHEEVYSIQRIPAGYPPMHLEMRDCLIEWTPGALRRFGFVAEGADARGFTLGSNLWFSKEIPLALELLGPKGAPFPGTLEAPQRMDIDPRLSELFYPLAAEAAAFGAPQP
jgi:hypothetical protein